MSPQADLRERMARVASKPPRKTARAGKPAVPVISVVPEPETVAVVRPVRRRAATPRRRAVVASPAAVEASSRVATLLAWARWEVVEANRKRWEWLQGVVFGR